MTAPIKTKRRYIVMHACGADHGSALGDWKPLQQLLDECPLGYKLHSFQSFNSGGGHTLYWKVVFERDFT